MTKKEAIADAEARMRRTGLTWNVIRIKQGWFKRDYETVSEHHKDAHQTLYDKGIFKVVDTFIPEVEKEWSYSNILRQPGEKFNSYLNLDRATTRKLERKLNKLKKV